MMKDVITGQECICPDGLGRVNRVEHGPANSMRIYVDTYIRNRCCGWDAHNVELINPRGKEQ